MQFRLERQSVLTLLNVFALIVVFGLAFREFALPGIAKFYYEDEYKELMFECDNVMRDHFIAKRRVRVNPSPETVKQLRASEVGLMECHEYDELRKRLLVLGLSEYDLARLGLEAIEEKANDVRTFVETHAIRY